MAPADFRSFLWCFFGFRGRLSREPYLLGLLAMTLLATLSLAPLMDVQEEQMRISEYALPIVLISNVVQFALVIKRLHDFGKTGLYSVIIVVPIVNIVFALALALIPGNPGQNRYGDMANVPPA